MASALVLGSALPPPPLLLAALVAGAVVLLIARADMARLAPWMLISGWFLFALTSPTAQFPLILRPLGVVLAGAGAALARIGSDAVPRGDRRSVPLPSRLLIVFVAFVLLGCLASPNGPRNLIRGIEGVLIIAAALYGVALGYRDWLVGGVLVASLANVVLTAKSGAPEVLPGVVGEPERLSGYMHPNHVAFAAAIVLIGAVGLWKRRKLRLILVGSAAIASYDLLASRSRTGLLAVIAAVAIAGMASVPRQGRARVGAMMLVAALVLAPLLATQTGGWVNRDATSTGSASSGLTSLTGRTDFWPPVIHMIEQRPVVGWGVNAILTPAGAKVQAILPGVGQAHNAYLEAALMGGLPAAVAWGLSLLAVVVGAFRLPQGDPRRFGLIACAILIELYAITESSPAWFGDMFIIYVLLIAVYAEARSAADHPVRPAPDPAPEPATTAPTPSVGRPTGMATA